MSPKMVPRPRSRIVVNLGDAAKRDPIPLALAGVGVAWLMM